MIRNSNANQDLLGLTCLAALIEIALLSKSYSSDDPLFGTCLILAMFHFGYIMANQVIHRCLEFCKFILFGSVVALSLVVLIGWNWVLASLIVLVLSSSLQAWRRNLKIQANITSLQKNSAKAIGMCLGVVGVLADKYLFFIFLAIAILIISRRPNFVVLEFQGQTYSCVPKYFVWVEFFHHAHYFTYVYIFWAQIEDLDLRLLGPLFLIGWLGYFLLEYLFRERNNVYLPSIIVGGHVICAFAIGSMMLTSSLLITMILWFITGVGGGTSYMLSHAPQHPKRELYEDWGHVVGVVSAAGIIAMTGSIKSVLLVAAILALITAAISMKTCDTKH